MSVTPIAERATETEIDQLCINTIRTLSIDAVQQAKSGHPGTPMALAPLVYTIWNRVMRFDPHGPRGPGRERVLFPAGPGHGRSCPVFPRERAQRTNAGFRRAA